MAENVTELRQELSQLQDDIKACDEMLALEPNDTEAIELKAMLQEQIADLKARISELTQSSNAYSSHDAPPPPPPPTTSTSTNAPPPAPPENDSFTRPNGDTSHHEVEHVLFNVKDTVMAKYSGDKQWYQATITTRTGSSTEPVYYVAFKGYGTGTEKKYKHEVRPLDNRKRKNDTAHPTTSNHTASAASPYNSGAVISAAASVDPSLVHKREPSKVSDGPTRMAPEPKRLKTSKALDKAQSSWQSFQAKGPKKGSALSAIKPKESQFRTGEGGRVGFVGSGQPMKKDQARARWTYQQNGARRGNRDEDDED